MRIAELHMALFALESKLGVNLGPGVRDGLMVAAYSLSAVQLSLFGLELNCLIVH